MAAFSPFPRRTPADARITPCDRQALPGVGQISIAVADMDQMTQQNAALVEEAAAAAESLDTQARQLVTLMSRFRLATDPAHASAA